MSTGGPSSRSTVDAVKLYRYRQAYPGFLRSRASSLNDSQKLVCICNCLKMPCPTVNGGVQSMCTYDTIAISTSEWSDDPTSRLNQASQCPPSMSVRIHDCHPLMIVKQ